jgi:hypothetical protein
MLSWSWRSIKLLLLHLVGFPYYCTYNDAARSHTNQVYSLLLRWLFCHCRKLLYQKTIIVGPHIDSEYEPCRLFLGESWLSL